MLGLGLEIPYEIIVVDNASGDHSIPYLTDAFGNAEHVRIIAEPENRGYAAGNNKGIEKAKGEYILILNPDILVLPGAIEALLAAYEKHPNAAVIGPQLLNPDRSVQYSCYRFPNTLVPVYRRTILGRLPFAQSTLDWYLMKDWDHSTERTVEWILGACLCFRKSTLDRIGMFDERFFLYFEDVDWCRRAWDAENPVLYWPHARMIHYHQRQSAGSAFWALLTNAVARAHVRSGLKYFWKYRSSQPRRLSHIDEQSAPVQQQMTAPQAYELSRTLQR